VVNSIVYIFENNSVLLQSGIRTYDKHQLMVLNSGLA